MKKELNELITLADHDKSLTLNGAFKLVARYLDETGANVALSSEPPVTVVIDLVCTMPHDKFMSRSTPIKARDAAEMQREIASKMVQMFTEFSSELANQVMAGYLPN